QRATGHLLEAHRIAPREPELASHLGRLYWERLTDAESRRERFLAQFYQGQLLALGRPEDARRLSAGGHVSVECHPIPKELTLHRLVEDRRVLRPGDPVELSRKVRSDELSIGAYQLEVKAEGFPGVRLPVRVERECTTEVSLALRRDSDIGDGFVWIPAGEFIMGGDPDTFESVPRAEVEVEDFCIARFPVTWEQYQAYLQARLDSGDDIEEWMPKLENAHGRPWHIRDGQVHYAQASENAPVESRRQWPVFSVTHTDAVEYCRWRTENEGRVYDLPTDSEWEKAARGVDERVFPWGNRFDPSLCRNSGSSEGRAQPGPVGEYEADCSPYGVRDMAGGVREWCASWFNEKDEQRLIRGGSWNFGEIGAHCAYRLGCSPSLHFPFIGFRLVHRFESA
ncbi:MAG: SUMF1/EgtB/PvdO family nonheme iron enzyme, partial [Planctomycetota bacterium]